MLKVRTTLLLILVCLAVTSNTPAGSSQVLEAPRLISAPYYLIQPNDILKIFVWKEPNLTGNFLVRPDGRISFPLVQDVQASGLNTGQLKERLETGLRQYLDVPNVTVIVEAIQSYRVFVTGKVGKPGAIIEPRPINVLQAISLAGGLIDFAKESEIVIIRGSAEEGNLWKFNYPEVIKGNNFSQNILLRNGDVVVVP